jgi:hypothetical protein
MISALARLAAEAITTARSVAIIVRSTVAFRCGNDKIEEAQIL